MVVCYKEFVVYIKFFIDICIDFVFGVIILWYFSKILYFFYVRGVDCVEYIVRDLVSL